MATLAAIYDSFGRENTGLLFQQVKGFPMFCKHSFSMPCTKEVTCHWQRVEISIRALLNTVMLEYKPENNLSLQLMLEKESSYCNISQSLLENDKASPQFCHGLNLTLHVHIGLLLLQAVKK